MNEAEHRFAFESLGAYALGAMPDAERERIGVHIADCPICAEDVAQLERGASRLVDPCRRSSRRRSCATGSWPSSRRRRR